MLLFMPIYVKTNLFFFILLATKFEKPFHNPCTFILQHPGRYLNLMV